MNENLLAQQHNRKQDRGSQSGFTLVELLVVIFIIGVLAALLLSNFVGIRGRASDTSRKNDLQQVKTALRMYYNDFQQFPSGTGSLRGCGAAGTSACSAGGAFSAGTTVYMAELPSEFSYYSNGGDAFLLTVRLDNVSDEGITTAQQRCRPGSRSYFTGTVSDDLYVVCE